MAILRNARLLMAIMIGFAFGGGCAPLANMRSIADRGPSIHTDRLPDVPLVKAPPAVGLTLDGELDEPAWTTSRAYDRFGLDSGLGRLDFPTSLRFLREGRTLWIGLTCEIPPGRDGQPVPGALEKESLELWLDNGGARRAFHHIMLNLDGQASSPGIDPTVIAKAVVARFVASTRG